MKQFEFAREQRDRCDKHRNFAEINPDLLSNETNPRESQRKHPQRIDLHRSSCKTHEIKIFEQIHENSPKLGSFRPIIRRTTAGKGAEPRALTSKAATGATRIQISKISLGSSEKLQNPSKFLFRNRSKSWRRQMLQISTENRLHKRFRSHLKSPFSSQKPIIFVDKEREFKIHTLSVFFSANRIPNVEENNREIAMRWQKPLKTHLLYVLYLWPSRWLAELATTGTSYRRWPLIPIPLSRSHGPPFFHCFPFSITQDHNSSDDKRGDA